MSVRDELMALKEASDDGLLHADKVVEWAQANPNSAIYKSLEWDDVRAALEYRIHQVRALIRIHIISEDGSPQLVSLSMDRATGGGYRAVSDVVASRDLSAIMLADALKELERIQTKYARVQQLTNVWNEVQKVARRSRRKAGAESRVSAA